MHSAVTDRREISSIVRLDMNLELVARWQRGGHNECDGRGSRVCSVHMAHMEAGTISTALRIPINCCNK